MPAYVIAMVNVKNPELYSTYTAQTPSIIQKYGGKFIARGGEVEMLSGDPVKERVVLLEFPDVASIRRWHESPEYQEIVRIRYAASEGKVFTVEGAEGLAPAANVKKTD